MVLITLCGVENLENRRKLRLGSSTCIWRVVFFYFLYVISNYIINITINTISHITPRISPRAFGSRADIGVSG